jgi:F420-non-reducing hydrogenase iron-sulfur subunit
MTDAATETKATDMKEWRPVIVAYLCNWCTYAGADLAGTSRLTYPADIRIIRVPCSGRVDPLFIIRALQDGADGVLVSGCHPGDCHYSAGNYYARRRFMILRELLDLFGIDLDRVQFSWVSAAEGIKWSEVVTDVTNKIRELGPAQGLFAPRREMP